jgi:hypothetical protein
VVLSDRRTGDHSQPGARTGGPGDRTPGRLSKDREGMPTLKLCKRMEDANELGILKREIPGRILIATLRLSVLGTSEGDELSPRA